MRTFVDVLDTNGNDVKRVWIDREVSAVAVGFDEFGMKHVAAGEAAILVIEVRDGIPHVVIWADIRSEEPTHVISLEGAREILRLPD